MFSVSYAIRWGRNKIRSNFADFCVRLGPGRRGAAGLKPTRLPPPGLDHKPVAGFRKTIIERVHSPLSGLSMKWSSREMTSTPAVRISDSAIFALMTAPHLIRSRSTHGFVRSGIDHLQPAARLQRRRNPSEHLLVVDYLVVHGHRERSPGSFGSSATPSMTCTFFELRYFLPGCGAA